MIKYIDFFINFDIIILVIKMSNYENIIVTNIGTPIVVHSEKGRNFQMENRMFFGISLCISGQITYSMNSKKIISEKDNAVLLPQGGNYSLRGDKDGLFPVINFECKNLKCDEIEAFYPQNIEACKKDFETIKHLSFHKEQQLKMYSVFYELLNKIFTVKTADNPVSGAIRHIEENLSNPLLSNEELAKLMGISEVYLRKLFLTHCQITPKQYILETRIKNAKRLLADTPYSVTAIAEECGFSSVYHFCRIFKQKTGLTPTQYAENNKIFKI